jgi:REP element-mobilizing transposase RayT
LGGEDHFHALVFGESPESELRGFARVAKQVTSHQFRRLTGNKLWRDDYWDRTLRDRESTVDLVRYIVLNPVKPASCQTLSTTRIGAPGP